MCTDTKPSWMDPLFLYLREGKLPEDESKDREIKKKARYFVIVGEELYKRSFLQPLLKCVRPREADYVLSEVHEGICGSHIGLEPSAKKLFGKGTIGQQ